MALWRCRECRTAYAVGAPACPHCGSTDHVEVGSAEDVEEEGEDDMAKITRHGGPSYDPAEQQEEEVPSSPGTSSSPSSEKPETSSAQSETAPRSRARTTVSRSPRARTGSSSASSTAGAQTAPAADDE